MWALYHHRIDLAILIVALLVAFLLERLWPSFRQAIERTSDFLVRVPARSYLVIGLLAFAGSMAVSLTWRFPVARTHDEFSYLLAADTFASGRLANPTHSQWPHFESFHILQRPTYASRYPAAQGLILALGRIVSGHEIAGVWLSASLGSAALCWMLMAWLPPSWALYASFLAVLRLGIAGYWSQSYVGGWAAACGGALLFGGLRRTLFRPRVSSSLFMALGLVILANSRPFIGLVISMPCALVLLMFMVRRRAASHKDSWRLIVVPMAGVLLVGALWMAKYNRAVTGSPFELPHKLYAESYMTAPYFLIADPRPAPRYRHLEMARFHGKWELEVFEKQRSPRSWFQLKRLQWSYLWKLYLGAGLVLPFLLIPWSRGDPWVGFALAMCGIYLIVNLFMTWSMPHYSAPLAPLVFFLVAVGVRAADGSGTWKRFGKTLQMALPLYCLGSLIFALVNPQDLWPEQHPDWSRQRARIVDELEQIGGHHLILVRYQSNGPRHNFHEEWVYNRAEIDSAQVVWAREMGDRRNRKLIRYFADRQIWLLEPELPDPRLKPYPFGLP